MKVLQINSVCGVGSTGRIATDLHGILKEQGYESYIAYGRGEARNCENTIKIGNKIGNYFHVAQTRVFDRHGLGSYYDTKKFIKQIEEFNPDIIHLHNIHGYYVNIKLLFKYLKKINKPVVWTLHDCWAFTGHCSYFDYIGCNEWKKGCAKCSQIKEYPKSIFKYRTKYNYLIKKNTFKYLNNMTIVTPSKWLAELVKESFLGEYPVQVINNGIDLGIFQPTKSSFRKKYGLEDKFIILGVASVWERRKGLDYFIQLANQLEEDEIIVVVGVTEQQKGVLPDRCIGITKTNNIKELAEIYSAADVFVNPTLEDNFPTVNLEALACGTPIITFNTGGCIECIDESTGKIIYIKSSKEIAKKIKEIKSEKNIYTESCLKKSKEFSKQEACIKYLSLYNGIKG